MGKIQIRTLCAVYAAPQKQQKSQFRRVDAGAVDYIKFTGTDECGVKFHLVEFHLDSKNYFAKINSTTCEVVENIQ